MLGTRQFSNNIRYIRTSVFTAPVNIRDKARTSVFTAPTQQYIGKSQLIQKNQKKKEKPILEGREVKQSMFADDIIVQLRKHKESTKLYQN